MVKGLNSSKFSRLVSRLGFQGAFTSSAGVHESSCGFPGDRVTLGEIRKF